MNRISAQCIVCLESYDEKDHRPLIHIPCGHGTCSRCITLLSNPKKCPECVSPVDVSVQNYDLLRILESIKQVFARNEEEKKELNSEETIPRKFHFSILQKWGSHLQGPDLRRSIRYTPLEHNPLFTEMEIAGYENGSLSLVFYSKSEDIDNQLKNYFLSEGIQLLGGVKKWGSQITFRLDSSQAAKIFSFFASKHEVPHSNVFIEAFKSKDWRKFLR